MSRGKNTTQIYTYENGTSDKAVDGDYSNADLEQCATLLYPQTTRSSTSVVQWEVDLEDLYAIVSVTIYNTAVLPGMTPIADCWFSQFVILLFVNNIFVNTAFNIDPFDTFRTFGHLSGYL